MVNINLAYTAPINPPSASPVLTLPQVWAGLQRKIRHAEEFVPIITSCEVQSDENGIVRRTVKFEPGVGARDEAKETVKSFEPCWVDFEQDHDGTHIRNIVSDGQDGTLQMTYVFEIRLPHLQEGSEAIEKETQKFKAMSKKAVESSIDVIREMVKDGRIKA